jgi:tRNA (cytosine38-C5)-methyltransferase
MAERSGSILQMNDKLNVRRKPHYDFINLILFSPRSQTTTVFNEFLASKASGNANAVRILDPLRLRYFSPTELLRLLCFLPSAEEKTTTSKELNTFTWPESVSTKTKFRLLGNSVNVEVVSSLIDYLFT